MVYYGQLVVGPPGCGKTTYCNGMSQFCNQMGRAVSVINLDFANEHITKHRLQREGDDSKASSNHEGAEEDNRAFYDCAIDVRDLVSLENVMEEYTLGPNGGLIFCMEYLKEHIDWLLEKISTLEDKYLIIDCPGQVELYSHQTVVQDIINILQKRCVYLESRRYSYSRTYGLDDNSKYTNNPPLSCLLAFLNHLLIALHLSLLHGQPGVHHHHITQTGYSVM